MTPILLVAGGTIAYALLDFLQREYVPAAYIEVLDLSFGIDPTLDLRKVLFRLGFPFAFGVILAAAILLSGSVVVPWAVSAVSAALGTLMHLAPAFWSPNNRSLGARRLTSVVVLAYVSFVIMSGVLAAAGAEVTLAAAQRLGVESVGGLVRTWFRDEFANDLISFVFFGVLSATLFSLWRFLVGRIPK